MLLTPFERSRTEFPGLPQKLLAFFDHSHVARTETHAIRPRTIQEFISDHAANNGRCCISRRSSSRSAAGSCGWVG